MNLTATQSMMGMLDGIDTADSDYLENKISEARWFAGIGTAGPAIVAGTMLIMFRIAIALFIGFAPIFILCLLFKKTAPLFQKWLYYGLATIFSSVMLGVMADIAMDLVSNIAITDAVTRIASILGGGNLSGIMQTVTQQLGLGLVLSTLLIVVPPMAGAWFSGVMASFTPYSAIERWNNPNGGGVPPHMDGGASRQVNQPANSNIPSSNTNQAVTNHNTFTGWNPPSSPSVDPNMVKPHGSSSMGAAGGPLSIISNLLPQPSKEKEKEDK